MNVRQIVATVLLVVSGIYVIAKEVEGNREPAAVPKKNGVVCGQGQSITIAEQKLNDKLGIAESDTMTSMTGKYGKIANAKVTGVTVNVIPGKPAEYVLCAALTGD